MNIFEIKKLKNYNQRKEENIIIGSKFTIEMIYLPILKLLDV